MPRPAKPWRRKGREGWWATIDGRQVCLAQSYDDALKELHRRKGSTRLPPNKATVAQLADEYLAWAEPRVKPITHRRYRGYLQSWVRHAGRVAVAAVSLDLVERWRDNPRWNPSTRWLAMAILRRWANWCAKRGYPIPAAKEADVPPMGRRKAPPPGALEATLAAIRSPEFADFAAVLLDVGCRPGELATLEASRIDWEASAATVRGKTGERVVGLTTRAVDILRRHAAKHPKGPVLRNSRGRPWRAQAISTQFRRCSTRAGKGRVVAYHCRHAFWGRAHEAGLSDIVVASQMGHANLNMLARHYAHVKPEHLRDAAERASQNGMSPSPQAAASKRSSRVKTSPESESSK